MATLKKFDELREAALSAQSRWEERQQNVRGTIATFLESFQKACNIPPAYIEYFGNIFTKSHALAEKLDYDEINDSWEIAVRILFTDSNEMPQITAMMKLVFKEQGGIYTVFADGSKVSPSFDPHLQPQREQVYIALADKIALAFENAANEKLAESLGVIVEITK